MAPWETDWHIARAALGWQLDMGVDEAIGDAPVSRYELPDKRATAQAPAQAPARAAVAVPAGTGVTPSVDPVAHARHAAESAGDLAALQAALGTYDHCELKLGARNLVFADGRPDARVMIIGEAPGREEDRQGKPFVGEAGQLLDRMFAAIGMGRDNPDPAKSLYITNILPWRPPQNRDPSTDERAMMRPFVQRHIELVDPDILILMGRISAGTLLETSEGITRLRGQWCEVTGRPCLPMLHPAYLLRNPPMKRHAWADLLSLQARLRDK